MEQQPLAALRSRSRVARFGATGVIILAFVGLGVVGLYSSLRQHPFIPVQLSRTSTFVVRRDLLASPEFRASLAAVLTDYLEPVEVKGEQVFVSSSLASDQDMRMNYTNKAIDRLESK